MVSKRDTTKDFIIMDRFVALLYKLDLCDFKSFLMFSMAEDADMWYDYVP